MATTVVTAVGGGCIEANCFAIAWNWRNFTKPSAAMNTATSASIEIIRFAMRPSPSDFPMNRQYTLRRGARPAYWQYLQSGAKKRSDAGAEGGGAGTSRKGLAGNRRRDERLTLKHAANGRQKIEGKALFHDEPHWSERQRALHVLALGVHRDEDQLGPEAAALQAVCGRDATKPRHLDVNNEHVRVEVFGGGDQRPRIRDGRDDIVLERQDTDQAFEHRVVVVRDQHPRPAHATPPGRAFGRPITTISAVHGGDYVRHSPTPPLPGLTASRAKMCEGSRRHQACSHREPDQLGARLQS